MKLVFIGPQGSGKGTHARIVSEKLGVPHISTGDLMRNAAGELRKEIDSYIINGNLFPDEGTFRMLKERIEKEDCKNGFVLDGFPRNINQAKMLREIFDVDKVLELWISDDTAIERISNRMTCKNCGEIFNLVFKRPRQENRCDKCNGILYKRDDDLPESLSRRLEIYHRETEPILKELGDRIVRVEGEVDISKTQEKIATCLGLSH